MDINLPRMSGIDCVAQLKLRLPHLLVLMLTVYEDDDSIFRALKAGANGYLVKRDASEKLLEALQELGCLQIIPVAREAVLRDDPRATNPDSAAPLRARIFSRTPAHR